MNRKFVKPLKCIGSQCDSMGYTTKTLDSLNFGYSYDQMASLKGCKKNNVKNRIEKRCVQVCEEEMSLSYMNYTTKAQWQTFVKLVKQIDKRFDILDGNLRRRIDSINSLD